MQQNQISDLKEQDKRRWIEVHTQSKFHLDITRTASHSCNQYHFFTTVFSFKLQPSTGLARQQTGVPKWAASPNTLNNNKNINLLIYNFYFDRVAPDKTCKKVHFSHSPCHPLISPLLWSHLFSYFWWGPETCLFLYYDLEEFLIWF